MTTTQIAKLQTLLQIITEKYRAACNPHPEVAGRYQLDLVMGMIRGQEQYADQLIDEEIEAARKATR